MALFEQYDKKGRKIINRYKLMGKWSKRMRLHFEGDWVKYKDIESYITKKRKKSKEAYFIPLFP